MAEILAFPGVDAFEPAQPLFAATERINDLIPGGEYLLHDVVFGQDTWDLAGHPEWHDKAGTATRFPFAKLSRWWRDAAKELALLQMNPVLAAERAPGNPMADNWAHIQEPTKPVTAQGNLKALTYALQIADAHHLVRFDADDWERLPFLLVQPASVEDKQTGATLSPLVGRGRAQQLAALWQATQIAGRNGLLGHGLPFGGREINELFANRGKRNLVRPHEHVGHLLGFTAWLIDHVAEDVIAHVEWWASNSAAESPVSQGEVRQRMLGQVLEIAHRTGGKVPGSRNVNGELTLAHSPLARLLGVYNADEAFDAGRWVQSQLRGRVILDESCSPCPLPITVVPTLDGGQKPWTSRLLATKSGLDIWQRRIVYACMYYLSATLMLRDSQLAILTPDCVTAEEIQRSDGTSYTKRTLSAHKTKNRHMPVPTKVAVNGRIQHVIALMGRLQRALGYEPSIHSLTGLRYLFDQRLATPLGKKARVNAREGLYLDQWFVELMKEAGAELHNRAVIRHSLDNLKVNMRQVRITAGQAYAVREHGQALAAAFGQWDTAAVARGYIGDIYKIITPLEPEEVADVTQEDIGRRMRWVAAQRDTLTGNGLPRFDAAVTTAGAPLSNPAPLTPARLKSLGKKNRNVTQGPLTLCMWQAEGAMCDGEGKPNFRLCFPGRCRNSVMTRADRARYELMRRQQLAIGSESSHRAAAKMDEGNPHIRKEFQDLNDDDVYAIVLEHVNAYVREALKGAP
ncbi:hypothetical protein AB0A91_34545 [Streptomyces sp. NPDC042207]|uniref:hypothetical protein n=1 Tax=Streptomyces sp. NPDC042207 TaxID=3154331 RepID=UPI0033EB553D